jgi:hypothetical protein
LRWKPASICDVSAKTCSVQLRFLRKPACDTGTSSVDNTSPCLNPCRVLKGSEQSFRILTQHVTMSQ